MRRDRDPLLLVAYTLPSASFTTGIALGAIVGPPSTCWRNSFPALDDWHCRLSWSRRDCRLGGYGPGTPPLRRRMSSRPEVTPGAPESSGDRNAGIARPVDRGSAPDDRERARDLFAAPHSDKAYRVSEFDSFGRAEARTKGGFTREALEVDRLTSHG